MSFFSCWSFSSFLCAERLVFILLSPHTGVILPQTCSLSELVPTNQFGRLVRVSGRRFSVERAHLPPIACFCLSHCGLSCHFNVWVSSVHKSKIKRKLWFLLLISCVPVRLTATTTTTAALMTSSDPFRPRFAKSSRPQKRLQWV